MARTTVTVTQPNMSNPTNQYDPDSGLVAGAALPVAAVTATPLNGGVGNGHVVPAGARYLRIANTAASALVLTFAGGVGAGRGDAAEATVPASSTALVVVDSGRFGQNDGGLLVDVPSGASGSIEAVA